MMNLWLVHHVEGVGVDATHFADKNTRQIAQFELFNLHSESDCFVTTKQTQQQQQQ